MQQLQENKQTKQTHSLLLW